MKDSTRPALPPSGANGPAAPPAGADYASLELISIFKDAADVDRAHITVDGRSYQPAAGEVFSYGFRLERIDGNCVEVWSQDQRVDMCVAAA